jgi:predicted nucleic acid-binding protein
MSGKPFFDTNVVVYAFRKDDPRSQIAESLLAAGGELSVQILNEFVAVARRKLGRSWREVGHALAILRTLFPEPVALTIDTHGAALGIAQKHRYGIYDSLVIAAALEAGCAILYSEDLHDGQTIDGRLTIRNPFAQ